MGEALEPRFIHLAVATDDRGSIGIAEFSELPFLPRRAYIIHHVPSEKVRAAHAHRECHQLLIAASGSLRCDVADGRSVHAWRLYVPSAALYVPPLHWVELHDFSPDAALLVLASHPYDPDDYIRERP